MKSVLISIRPKWCEKIVNGEKTIEVRKTRPKFDRPFKCYIYCTKSYHETLLSDNLGAELFYTSNNKVWCTTAPIGNGKVIGEFVCDKITAYGFTDEYSCAPCKFYYITGNQLKQSCLSYEDLERYRQEKTLYGWHISDLKIYDKPKELGEFRKAGIPISRAFQSWGYVNE